MLFPLEFEPQGRLLSFDLALRGIGCIVGAMLASILTNVLVQQVPRSKTEPPVVFHWLPIIGNAISYGRDPCNFFKQCQEKVLCLKRFCLLRATS